MYAVRKFKPTNPVLIFSSDYQLLRALGKLGQAQLEGLDYKRVHQHTAVDTNVTVYVRFWVF